MSDQMIVDLQVIEAYSVIISCRKNNLMCSNFIFYDLMTNKKRNSIVILSSAIIYEYATSIS